MIQIKNDIDIDIATAHSRLAKTWKNRTWKWSELLNKCAETRRTGETIAEYLRMSREEQSSVKDVGGFVGGYLANGVRKTTNVLYRTVATLDIDYGTPDVWDDFTLSYGFAALLYSTHKHTKEKPRYRLVFPLSRQVSPAEYEPLCRRIAAEIGIDLFDTTTYQLPRLFYWASTSKDGEFVFEYQDGPICDVDAILGTYKNYQDVSEWTLSSREGEVMTREMRKAGDPTEKPGLIGAFCRAYSISEAIDKFLPDIYEKTAHEGRYTYKKGSVSGGLVVYEDKFAYSHHETDPASLHLCNAFDLCRLHLFGLHDEDSRATEFTRLPSYLKMQDFAASDKEVRMLLTEERKAEAFADFDHVGDGEEAADEESNDWVAELEYDRKGNVKPTPKTLKILMLNDPFLKMVKYDTFAQRDVIQNPACPFTGTHAPDEVDDNSLSRMCTYIFEAYNIDISVNKLMEKMLRATATERGFNPVERFILREKWDGRPRVETLLIDYLGAADTPLTRAVTRKWMAGAVGRALDIDSDTGEGIKFDYCLVLFGEQGTGKSTFAETLAGRWRGSISLSESKKEQCEAMQKSWIVEIPEFKGMKNAEMDAIKDLISRRSDDFRAAYARMWTKNPRHSVLIGSTNNRHFLKDVTGNRRFWIVEVPGKGEVIEWSKRLRAEVGQIWAEAYLIYKGGEPLTLTRDLEAEMNECAEEFNEAQGDPLREYLAEWLEIRLPADWEAYEPKKRLQYYRYYDPLEAKGTVERTSVALSEIITSCPYPGISKYSPQRISGVLKSLGWEQEKTRKRVDTTVDTKKGPVQKRTRPRIYVKHSTIENEDFL